MRIVFLLPMGLDRPSGRRYFHIARGLVRRGFQVRLLALHPDLSPCRQRRFILDGVEVWYVGQMHARKSGSTPVRFDPLQLSLVVARSTLAMVWGVICSPADYYHLGKPQPINGMAALLAARLWRRQPFLVDCDDDETMANRFTAAWQRALFAFWQWLLPRMAAGITTNTRYLAQRLVRPGQPYVVVPNGVDCANFTPPAPAVRLALARALGIENRPVIAYAGTLALHSHPVDLLLQAFAQVLIHCPDAVLLMIGGGEDLPHLQRYVAQQPWYHHVRFTGHVSHATVRALLSLADLSVDPVYDDPVARARSPLKLMESLALGIPVVTGDVGDRAEMLAFGAAGMVVRAGDPTALAAAIAELLADPSRRAAMAQAAVAQAHRHDWDKLAERWASIYHQLTTTAPE